MKEVNLDSLKKSKLIGKSDKKVKIFGDTPIKTKVIVEGINVTQGAKKSIEKAGGKVTEIKTIKKNNLKKEDKDK